MNQAIKAGFLLLAGYRQKGQKGMLQTWKIVP